MNGRPWMPDDTAHLRRMVASGMTHAAIGERMERRRDVICAKCKEHDIEPGISRTARALIARLNLQRMRRADIVRLDR